MTNHVISRKEYLLAKLDSHTWLNAEKLECYAEVEEAGHFSQLHSYTHIWKGTSRRMKLAIAILGVSALASGIPHFLNNFAAEDDDEEIGGVMDYLTGYGEKLYKQPNDEVGEMVKAWTPSSSTNPEELGTYVEGDILFPSGQKTRNGLKAKSARWPKGKVPYVYGSSFSEKDRSTIDAAIAEYHKMTCVRFVPRSNEADYLVFKSDNTGCWSSVGRVGGPQDINLQSPGCLVQKGTVMHEMMHALGFLHEQNRWERDDYVTINYANIQPGRENNFVKAEKSSTDALGITYDYGSVMHYSSTAFSINGQPTIVPKASTSDLGQRDSVSHHDVQKIRRMYKCKSKKSH
ncbi:hypothetical protein GE061_018642 [Apolygus lucorum]|uniref:Metalloendopeptidase n=1 Tax=Apolygus lucorum TaxID=248454 RepID=A0A8S9XEB7_APOLU|nr:hypothetical protein GE061_018642 [Apolygus lucorum]